MHGTPFYLPESHRPASALQYVSYAEWTAGWQGTAGSGLMAVDVLPDGTVAADIQDILWQNGPIVRAILSRGFLPME
jgi:hypothetical protein